MLRAGVADNTRGEKPVEVRIFLLHRDQAVGGEEDGPVEGLELLVLMPPGTAVVSHKMAVFLEGGVVVGRQHFTVGVHIHTGTLGLLEELLHILEVMAGDEDSGVIPDTQIYFGDLGVAIGAGVGLVKKSHGGNSVCACLHNHSNHIIHGEVFRGRGQPFHD